CSSYAGYEYTHPLRGHDRFPPAVRSARPCQCNAARTVFLPLLTLDVLKKLRRCYTHGFKQLSAMREFPAWSAYRGWTAHCGARSYNVSSFEELLSSTFWVSGLCGRLFFNRHQLVAELLSLPLYFFLEPFLALSVPLPPKRRVVFDL